MAVTKYHLLDDFIDISAQNQHIYRARRSRAWGKTAKGYRIALGIDKDVLILVVVVQLCEYTKSHWTVHVQWVNFMVREIFLNRVITKHPWKQQ